MKINIKDSQNFLYNINLVNDIVNKSNITKDDIIIEIGPGKGIITEILSTKAKEVIAIEYDSNFANELKEKSWKNVSIINTDFLNFELPKDYNYKLFSNIPFNLTSDIFNKILNNYENIKDFYFIMQYEAALTYVGIPNETFKSLLFKPIFDSIIIHEFKNTDFNPVPNVKIVLVHFHKKEYCDIKNALVTDYFDLLAYLFNTSGTSFKEKTKRIFTYEQQKRLKKIIKIDMNTPITKWHLNQFLGIFNCYKEYVNDDKKKLVKDSYIKLKKEQCNLDKIHRTRNY